MRLQVQDKKNSTVRFTVFLFVRTVLCAAALPACALAQFASSPLDAAGTQPQSSNGLGFGFQRNVNTYSWSAGGAYAWSDTLWELSAMELFQRSLVRTDRDNIRDEQNLRVSGGRALSSSVKVIGTFSSFIFSDNRALGINDLTNTKMAAGLSWRLFDELMMRGLAGFGSDRQLGTLDTGPVWSLQAALDGLRTGSNTISGDALMINEYLDPRFQQEQRAGVQFLTALSGSDVNTAHVQYRMISKDVYLDATDSESDRLIETRSDRIVSAADQLHFSISDALQMTAAADISQREVSRKRNRLDLSGESPVLDSDIDEFRLNGSLGMRYVPSAALRGEFRIEWNERDENHKLVRPTGINSDTYLRLGKLDEQKNNSITQVQIAYQLHAALSQRDTVSLTGAGVKMQYDTPSALNVDDRDELFLLAGIRWSHRFNHSITAALNADVNLRHTVYISSARSANNTWNRVIRCSPNVDMTFERFQMRVSSEVLANYTVYDFASLPQSPESYFLRQLIVADTATLWISRRVAVDAQVYVRLYERGALNWDAFTVAPAAFFDERTVGIWFRGETELMTASAGMRLFRQVRYKYDGSHRIRETVLTSAGPACIIKVGRPGGNSLSLEGWYQITTGTGTARTEIPNIIIQTRWIL